MDKSLMETKEKLCRELTDMVKKRDITVSDLDLIYKSVKTIYYLTTIEAMGEYSQDSYRGSYGMNYSRDGRAGRDGDSDGRYSEGYYGRSMDGSSMGGSYGYSGAFSGHGSKENLVRQMKEMMQDLGPREKQAVQDCINRMEG